MRRNRTESRPRTINLRTTTPTAIRTVDFGASLAAVFGVFVVGGCSCGFGEELFADLELEGADCGCAGDHDAHVGFDGGPVADGKVVPGHVIGVGELDEVFEAEDTDDCDAVRMVSMWIFQGWS
jgi:hypothetical protein